MSSFVGPFRVIHIGASTGRFDLPFGFAACLHRPHLTSPHLRPRYTQNFEISADATKGCPKPCGCPNTGPEDGRSGGNRCHEGEQIQTSRPDMNWVTISP